MSVADDHALLLHRAIASEFGVVCIVAGADTQVARQRLEYVRRAEVAQGHEELRRLRIRPSPTEEHELWIITMPREAPEEPGACPSEQE